VNTGNKACGKRNSIEMSVEIEKVLGNPISGSGSDHVISWLSSPDVSVSMSVS